MKELNDENFESEVNNGIVLVDFYADWCGPCKMVTPMLEEISNEITSANIVKVNVDESPVTAGKFSIRSIPTIVLLVDGKEVTRNIGAHPKQAYVSMIENA